MTPIPLSRTLQLYSNLLVPLGTASCLVRRLAFRLQDILHSPFLRQQHWSVSTALRASELSTQPFLSRRGYANQLRDFSEKASVITYQVDRDHHGKRLDVFLSERLPFKTLTEIQKEIKAGKVSLGPSFLSVRREHERKRLESLKVQSSMVVENGHRILVTVNNPPVHVVDSDAGELMDASSSRSLQAFEESILYCDEDLIIINKPPYQCVYPTGRYYASEPSLIQCLHLWHKKTFKERASFSGSPSELQQAIQESLPTPCHRIDRNTTGVLIAAFSQRAKKSIYEQFRERVIKKTYVALVSGMLKEDSGTVDTPIILGHGSTSTIAHDNEAEAKPATTHWRVVGRPYPDLTVVELVPHTGRRHQLRVHMAAIGHPILGDDKYGGVTLLNTQVPGFDNTVQLKFDRHALHAWKMRMLHPVTQEEITFTAAFPSDMKQFYPLS